MLCALFLKLQLTSFLSFISGYDCGMYVIAIAEHLCRELCEGYSIDLNEVITCDFVRKKRPQIKELIHRVANEFGS